MTTTLLDIIAQLKAEPGHVNYERHRHFDGPTVSAFYEGSMGHDALGIPHFETVIPTADRLVPEHGPDSKPFTAEPLTMITELSPTDA